MRGTRTKGGKKEKISVAPKAWDSYRGYPNGGGSPVGNLRMGKENFIIHGKRKESQKLVSGEAFNWGRESFLTL